MNNEDNVNASNVSPRQEAIWSLLLEVFNDEKLPFDERFYLCSLLSKKFHQ